MNAPIKAARTSESRKSMRFLRGVKMEASLAVFVFLTLGIAGGFDLYVLFWGNGADSVSAIIYSWSQRWPVIPFLAGVLAGHLFFPTVGPRR